MSSWKKLAVLLFVILFAVSAAACGGPAPAPAPDDDEDEAPEPAEPFVVGFLYGSPIGDEGWTYVQDLGRQYIEANTDNVETVYVESVPPGADAERVITQLIEEQGARMIFAGSSGYVDPVQNMAERYPDVMFVQMQGHVAKDNIWTVLSRDDQPFYLMGMVAGMMTETDSIGMVAAVPAPQSFFAINAYTLGARSVNENATVRVVWTNSWYDPALETDAAKSLIAAGADVIAQYVASSAPILATVEEGKFAFGAYVDMSKYDPELVLSGFLHDWGPLYKSLVDEAIAGTFVGVRDEGKVSNGVMKLASFSDLVPAEVVAAVEARFDEMYNETWDTNHGPIRTQDGELMADEGEEIPKDVWFNHTWYVEGIHGSPPTR